MKQTAPLERPPQLYSNATELRRRAEELLHKQTQQDQVALSGFETQKLLQELQVCQIELELQNEELHNAQSVVETVAARYTDLYDFSPIGLVSLTPEKTIQEINLAGARLLGSSSAKLMGVRFDIFVTMSDRPVFNDFLRQVFVSGVKQTCEVTLERKFKAWVESEKDQLLCTLEIEATHSPDGQECRMVLIDVTERKCAEEKTLQLLQQNRELAQRVFTIQEEERRYIARELHDEFGQQLAAIHLNAETIKMLSKKQHLKIHESAQVIDEIAIDVQKNIRGMLRQLRPTLLDETGLKDSLKELVNQWQKQFPTIDIKISMEGELNDFDENLNISIYRVIQESLTNVAKHAMAHNVSVQLIRQSKGIEAQDCLLLIVEDNGKGLDGTVAEGAELPGLRERVFSVGGKFAVKSIKGKGVHIEARIPINVTL